MKTLCFLILVFVYLFIGVNAYAQVKLSGHISNNTSREIVLITPVDGKYFAGSKIKATVEKNGNFTFNFNLDKPGFASLYNPPKGGPIRIYLHPNISDSLSFDQHDFKNSLTFYGSNAQQNAFINNPMRIREKYNRNSSVLTFKKDTLPEKVFEKVMEMRDDELRGLDTFAKENHLQSDFIKAMEWDIRYYYINLFNGVVTDYYYDSIRGRNTIFNEQWGRYWDKAMHLEKISNDEALVSSWYSKYVKEYIERYKTWYQEKEKFTNDDWNEGKPYIKYAEVINEYFSGEALENSLASLILSAAYQSRYEKSLITLYEQFIKKYPDSKYTKYITPYIQPIIAYHEVSDQIKEGIHIFEEYDKINTFKELVEPFKGKVIYIDLWATWCKPCLEEFQNVEALKEHFKDSKEVKFLYLSLDRNYSNNNTIIKWKKLIKLNNLKGIHFIANKNLSNAIYKKFGSHISGENYQISIPRYIIINKEGEVVESTAKKPSDKDALYKQIEQYL